LKFISINSFVVVVEEERLICSVPFVLFYFTELFIKIIKKMSIILIRNEGEEKKRTYKKVQNRQIFVLDLSSIFLEN
jgi:hypothetical protein